MTHSGPESNIGQFDALEKPLKHFWASFPPVQWAQFIFALIGLMFLFWLRGFLLPHTGFL